MNFSMKTKLAALLIVTGCASGVQMNKNLMDMEPNEAIETAQQRLEEARGAQAGLFSKDHFKDGEKNLSKAKAELKDNDRKEALEYAAYADAYFQRAIEDSKKDNSQYSAVLEAREAATSTNLYGVKKLNKKLEVIDNDFLSETKEFSRSISPEKIAAIQGRYLDLEGEAIEYQNLHSAKTIIETAEKNDADDLAPKTYRQARKSYLSAQNLVTKNPREPSTYTKAVTKANEDAVMLKDVMKVIKSEDKATPEKVAVTQVINNRKLNKAQTRLGLYQSSLSVAGDTIQSQNSELMTLESKVSFQKAMERIQSTFNEDEAEVYQQGNKLIVRLKEIGFNVGSAKIPSKSEPLLKKVSDVVQNIEANSIEVQGHTDATGSEKINKVLSNKRAEEVAQFMKDQGITTQVDSVGYASNKPLTNNKTAENRKLNRRVDVVITAKAPTTL